MISILHSLAKLTVNCSNNTTPSGGWSSYGSGLLVAGGDQWLADHSCTFDSISLSPAVEAAAAAGTDLDVSGLLSLLSCAVVTTCGLELLLFSLKLCGSCALSNSWTSCHWAWLPAASFSVAGVLSCWPRFCPSHHHPYCCGYFLPAVPYCPPLFCHC